MRDWMISMLEQDLEERQTFRHVLQSQNTRFQGKLLRIHILIFFITKFTSFDCKRYLQKISHTTPKPILHRRQAMHSFIPQG